MVKMIQKISYFMDNIKLKSICYKICGICIYNKTIYIYYSTNHGKLSTSKKKEISIIIDDRELFNKIDRIKLDSCQIYQESIDLIQSIDIDNNSKNELLKKLISKISQKIGAEIK